MTRRTLAFGCALAVAVAACGDEPAASQDLPPLPPLALRPFLPVLTALGDALPRPRDAEVAELRDLADLALHRVDGDERTVARAERALLEHPFAWSVLEPALAHTDVAVRKRAAWLCGRSGQTILQLPLVLRLKYELDLDGVLWVADALQRLGNDAGLPFLEGGMGAPATADQAGAMAIEICRERGLALAESPTWEQLRAHMASLAAAWRQHGASSRPGTRPPPQDQVDGRLAVHLATTQGTQLRPVDDARFVLTRTGVLAVPLLTRALSAEEPYLRTMALQVLADLGAPARSAAAAVLPLLADPLTATDAARTLGEIGATDALPHLRARLDAADTEMRAAIPHALGLLGDRASAATFAQRMQEPGEPLDVRVNAAFALLCLGPHPAAEAFLAERERTGDFHAPMLARLRERLRLLAR